mgnify:CR=1 FL=1|jgi:uncharacterized membrane protein YhaH (DUF805 family)|tara:strand:- start:58 stop:405 length:348 start_codon:yes stop_codon:yes gene_type:complete
MGFAESITTCMGKYATFEGRATRSEFWWFYLFTLLLGWGAIIVGAVSLGLEGGQILQGVVNLIFLLPFLAVSCRRMHDIGKSGWSLLWMFTIIGIPVVIYWWAKDTEHELVDSES